MLLFSTGFILLATTYLVDAQGAAFTMESCTNVPCAKEPFLLAFKLSGTPPGTASGTVGFYRNGESGTRPCAVDRLSACDSSTSCGCTQAGSDRIYYFNISSASSADHDGDWSAILPASTPSDTVRSQVCQVQVNDSCPYLVQDKCPSTLSTGETLVISFIQTRQFPSTAGNSLDFTVGGTTNVEGTVNWRACPQNGSNVGCFQRNGRMVYYFTDTAVPRHNGTWSVVVGAIPTTDTVQSDACTVAVPEPESYPVSLALVICLALIQVVYIVAAIALFFCDGNATVIVVFGGAVIVLAFVIAVGAYSLGAFVVVTKAFSGLYGASIAFIICGILALGVGLALGIKAKVQGSKYGNRTK